MIPHYRPCSWHFLLLLTVGLSTALNAQNSNILWQRTIEDYPNTILTAMAPDGNVGVICTNLGFPWPPELTKLGANGSLLWRSPIRGSIPEPNGSYIVQLYLLTATRDGGFVVLCRETIGGSYRRFVLIKFNSAGEQIWLEPLADYHGDFDFGLGITRYQALLEVSDGGILLAGSRTNTRFYTPFVVKHTSLGKYDRSLQVGGSSGISSPVSEIRITDLVETNNQYAVAGVFGPPSTGTIRYISRAGVLVNTVNFPNELSITDIDFDPTDNSLVATSRNSQGWCILKISNLAICSPCSDMNSLQSGQMEEFRAI